MKKSRCYYPQQRLPGYKCHPREKLEPVPGCAGGEQFDARTDFCILDDAWISPTSGADVYGEGNDRDDGDSSMVDFVGGSKPPLTGFGAEPERLDATPKVRLGVCAGDCDSDDDCAGDRICRTWSCA